MTATPKDKKLIISTAAVICLTAGLIIFLRTGSRREARIEQQKMIFFGNNLAPGETLISIFERRGIKANNYYSVISKFNKVYNAKKMQAGHYYELALSTENKILEFSYSPEVAKKYIVKLTSSGYSAEEVRLKIHKKYFGYSGTIKNNLYYSMISAGVNPTLIMTFADIFESRIDFLTDPRPGDKFFIVYEQSFTNNGQEVDKGSILAGKYIMSGGRRRRKKPKEFIAFAFPCGNLYDYYTPKGKSLRTQFLKAPLHFRRISSYFSNRRFHPILKYYRSHHGIDYAAPRGTPVSTIGDGKVVFVGRNGGYGKMIKIKHNSTYESWYGHLSRLRLPPAKSLTKKEMEEFLPLKKKYFRYIAEIIMNGKFKHENSLN